MNICLVSTYDVECGIATYTAALASEISKLGHDVTVLAERDPSRLSDRSSHGNVNVYRTWHRLTFRAEEFIKSVLGAPVKPDVIHFQHEYGIYPNTRELVQVIRELSKTIPIFITLHTVQAPPHNVEFIRRLASYAAIIVHTPTANAVVTAISSKSNPITIPHGLYINDEYSSIHDHFIVPGFMSPSKGHKEILAGYARYIDVFQGQTKLCIIGRCRDHNYLDMLNNEVISYGLSHKITIESKFVNDVELVSMMKSAQAVILGANKDSPYSTSGQMHTAIGLGQTVIAKNVPIYNNLPVALYNNAEELSILMAGFTGIDNQGLSQLAHDRTWEKVAAMHVAAFKEVS